MEIKKANLDNPEQVKLLYKAIKTYLGAVRKYIGEYDKKIGDDWIEGLFIGHLMRCDFDKGGYYEKIEMWTIEKEGKIIGFANTFPHPPEFELYPVIDILPVGRIPLPELAQIFLEVAKKFKEQSYIHIIKNSPLAGQFPKKTKIGEWHACDTWKIGI